MWPYIYIALLWLTTLAAVFVALVAAYRLARIVARYLTTRLRKCGCLFAGVFLLLFVAGFFVDLTSPSKVTKVNYDKIPIGMTKPEVEALLGPPGDYFSERPHPNYYPGWRTASVSEGTWSNRKFEMDWNGDEGGISLVFDQDNRVIHKTFHFGYSRLTWWCWTPIKTDSTPTTSCRELFMRFIRLYTEVGD